MWQCNNEHDQDPAWMIGEAEWVKHACKCKRAGVWDNITDMTSTDCCMKSESKGNLEVKIFAKKLV